MKRDGQGGGAYHLLIGEAPLWTHGASSNWGRTWALDLDLPSALGSGAAQTEGLSNRGPSNRSDANVIKLGATATLRRLTTISPETPTQDHFIRRDEQGFRRHPSHHRGGRRRRSWIAPTRIEQAFRDCVERLRRDASCIIHLHKFSPQGVSGVAVLAESHISVHTWPERRYGAFDVFMCGDAEPHRAVDVLRRGVQRRAKSASRSCCAATVSSDERNKRRAKRDRAAVGALAYPAIGRSRPCTTAIAQAIEIRRDALRQRDRASAASLVPER